MEQQNGRQNENKGGRYNHLGKAIFLGATVGVLAGVLLLGDPTLGTGIGADIGLVVSSLLSRRKNRTS